MNEEVADTRFRTSPGCKWQMGWFRARNEDGSVELTAAYNGAVRTVLPERVEFRTIGPRGGVVWVPAEQAERPMVTE